MYDDKKAKGVEDMGVTHNVEIDVKESINQSLKEVEEIREGKLPKKSYKEMIKKVRQQLSDESK